jgi:2-polyprenyl-6-methoxyphenol hydroxylase-like FAD-dependent oxidoreductase
MSPRNSKCRVLVVGAGPVGLFLAGELHRQGVECRLVDKSSGPCEHARATQIQPRTIEILAQIGLIDPFVTQGVVLRGVRTYANGDQLIDHTTFDGLDSSFPFSLSFPQYRTERELVAYLGRRGQPIERNVALVSLAQEHDGVRAELRHAGGERETVEAEYLVGCDGSHSTVRQQLGLHLDGSDYPQVFTVSDVRVEGPLASDETTLICSPAFSVFLAPLPEGRFLFSCEVPAEDPLPPPGSQPTLEKLQAYLDRVSPGNLRLHDPMWLSYFHCHKRLVPRYQVGRVFLAGDATHLQSPVGAQGMNTGVQDAFNLAWKLALVLRSDACPSLLDSYHAERYHVGQQMLALSDEMHRSLFEHHPTLRGRIGQWVGSLLVHAHLARLAQLTPDQTRISYHKSPIVRDHEPNRGGSAWETALRAGDRAPDGELISAAAHLRTRLLELIREPRHHLVILEGQQNRAERRILHELAAGVAARYGSRIEPHVVLHGEDAKPEAGQAWLDPNGALHRRYGAVQPCLYLIRPDGYVGYRSPTLETEALDSYLDELFVRE